MVKILHGADFHLDAPFSGLTPRAAQKQRQLQRKLVGDVVELANSNHCDLVLLPGDLFDSADIFPETLEYITKSFAACKCPIVIAPGNHDFIAPDSPYLFPIWSDNVHIFTENAVKSIDFPEINTTIWGAAFTAPTAPALLTGFSVENPARINIGLLHGDLSVKKSEYCPISRKNVEISALNYLALGHIHKRNEPEKIGATCVAYPGCFMGRGFDETGTKGVYLGEISKDSCTLTFAPLDGYKYEIIRIYMENTAKNPFECLKNRDFSNSIVRLILEGTWDNPDTLALEKKLSPMFATLTIRDCTTPSRDIWKEAGANHLKGLFLQELQKILAENPEEATLAAQFGLAVMEGREVPEP